MGQKISSIKCGTVLYEENYFYMRRRVGDIILMGEQFYLILAKSKKHYFITYKLKKGVEIDSNWYLNIDNIPDEDKIIKLIKTRKQDNGIVCIDRRYIFLQYYDYPGSINLTWKDAMKLWCKLWNDLLFTHSEKEIYPSLSEAEIDKTFYLDSENSESVSCIYNSSVSIIQENENTNICVICLTNNRNMLCRPCKHLCFCSDCALKCKNCPICRETITIIEKIYIS